MARPPEEFDEGMNMAGSDPNEGGSGSSDPVIEGPLGRNPVSFGGRESVLSGESPTVSTHVSNASRVKRDKLKLGRKRRPFQALIEMGIRSFAFLSFAAIVLIFIFVFKEAAPMFFGSGQQAESGSSDSSKNNANSLGTAVPDTGVAVLTNPTGSSKEKFATLTKTETKIDASGKKIQVTKEGGNVEQEVFDPFASDAPATTPKKDTAAAPTKIPKPVVKKTKPAPPVISGTADSTSSSTAVVALASDSLSPVKTSKPPANKKPIADKKSSSDKKPAPNTKPAAETKATLDQPKADLTYTKSTNGGSVAQDVFDPFANQTGLATIKPRTKSKLGGDSAVVAPMLDSNQLRLAKIEQDSARAKELRAVEERKHVTNFSHLMGTVWQPVSTIPKFGLIALLIGTLKVTLLSILFGAPIAISAALYTSTFASKWAREIIKPAIELLAGFPSVVIGFFALIVMATVFQDLFHYQFRLNSLLGGIAMSFAVMPIIYTITEDALTAVPGTLREASDALGATKWQTAFKVVLPAAIPGVFAAVVLGFGRAFGETMIALMATGNAALSSANILEPVRTFAATIGAEMAEVVFGDQHYQVLFLIGSLLFVFTFSMNALVEFYVRKRLLRRIQGR
jgi:phosphate transport system permease protein